MVVWENDVGGDASTAAAETTHIANGRRPLPAAPADELAAAAPNAASSTSITTTTSSLALPLMLLARDNEWDELRRKIERAHPDVIRTVFNTNDSGDDQDVQDGENDVEPMPPTLLHAAVSSHIRVPMDIVQAIVDKGGKELATITDNAGDTPLHKTVYRMPERYDIASYLIEQAPSTVKERNHLQYRPIDLISHRIIMMEEVIKYAEKEDHESDLERMWQTVHYLARASVKHDNLVSDTQPLVHACLECPGFPRSLAQRAIKRYKDQIRIPNQDGDLPLHIVAKKPPVNDQDDEMIEMADDAEDLFRFLLRENLEAATVLNHKQRSPLATAIDVGHTWDSGIIRISISMAPASVGTLDLPTALFPFLLERLVQESRPNEVFGVLRTIPPT